MLLKQSTARNRPVLMVDSTDHLTGITGLTLTITASKNGGSFSTITPTVTDLGEGVYNLALTTGHTDTLGSLWLHVDGGATADVRDVDDEVVVDLPGAGVIAINEPALSDVAAAIWAYTPRSLTTFGTLTSDVATAVWSFGTRTLTNFGSLAADVWAASTRTLTSFGSLAIGVADAILGRNLEGGSDGGRTVKEALYMLRNRREISAGGTVTVYKTDDSTVSWSGTATTSAGNPVTKIDPS